MFKHSKDAALRAIGALLIALASLAIWKLGEDGHAAATPNLLDAFVALAGFVAGSAGSALLIVGRHLFDHVELSERWTRRGR